MKNLILLIFCTQFLTGCGTFVTERYFELKADSGNVVNDKISRCGGPGSHITFDLKNGRGVTIAGWTGAVLVSLRLNKGDTFQFVSKNIQVSNGWPANVPTPTLDMISQYQATDVISVDEHYGSVFLRGPIKLNFATANYDLIPSPKFAEFQLKLPDGLLNGDRVSFPIVGFSYKEISYYKELCLK